MPTRPSLDAISKRSLEVRNGPYMNEFLTFRQALTIPGTHLKINEPTLPTFLVPLLTNALLSVFQLCRVSFRSSGFLSHLWTLALCIALIFLSFPGFSDLFLIRFLV